LLENSRNRLVTFGDMMLQPHMPTINDLEDSTIPSGLPYIIDAHVHIFPSNIFSAVWKWFDQHGWHIRYQMTSSQVLAFLISHGVGHIIAFQYAHKPEIAGELNQYMSRKCLEYDGKVTGLATVYPGERDAEKTLQKAFDSGLGGLKLHAHVQCFDMNSDEMNVLYECCRRNKKPIVMHVGREPRSAAYRCDPYEICSAEKLERVLKDFPELKICVPHLGLDEISAYQKLIEKYDNLWLDTAMAVASYFPIKGKIDLNRYRSDRVMYGSDFPNIPYPWDRELKILKMGNISYDTFERILYKNAADFFSLNLHSEK
jgi:predicted TIM-barrel fold metal-dependent hydrolase